MNAERIKKLVDLTDRLQMTSWKVCRFGMFESEEVFQVQLANNHFNCLAPMDAEEMSKELNDAMLPIISKWADKYKKQIKESL